MVYDKPRPSPKLDRGKEVYANEFYLIVQDFNHRMSDEMFMYPLWKNFKYTYGYENKDKCALRLRMDDGSSLPWWI